jgi:uncharacterized protein (DUF488 family)
MPNPFFTIGHSTRPIEVFVALVTAAEVKLAVDVRTVPRSRTNPERAEKEDAQAQNRRPRG